MKKHFHLKVAKATTGHVDCIHNFYETTFVRLLYPFPYFVIQLCLPFVSLHL